MLHFADRVDLLRTLGDKVKVIIQKQIKICSRLHVTQLDALSVQESTWTTLNYVDEITAADVPSLECRCLTVVRSE